MSVILRVLRTVMRVFPTNRRLKVLRSLWCYLIWLVWNFYILFWVLIINGTSYKFSKHIGPRNKLAGSRKIFTNQFSFDSVQLKSNDSLLPFPENDARGNTSLGLCFQASSTLFFFKKVVWAVWQVEDKGKNFKLYIEGFFSFSPFFQLFEAGGQI